MPDENAYYVSGKKEGPKNRGRQRGWTQSEDWETFRRWEQRLAFTLETLGRHAEWTRGGGGLYARLVVGTCPWALSHS